VNSLTWDTAARAVRMPASSRAMSSTSGSDSTSWDGLGQVRGGGRFSRRGRGRGRGWLNLGRGEAARGEEVGEVGRQPHLRDQLVGHRCRRRARGAGRRGRIWGGILKCDSKFSVPFVCIICLLYLYKFENIWRHKISI
jgi:hypothetical protein